MKPIPWAVWQDVSESDALWWFGWSHKKAGHAHDIRDDTGAVVARGNAGAGFWALAQRGLLESCPDWVDA